MSWHARKLSSHQGCNVSIRVFTLPNSTQAWRKRTMNLGPQSTRAAGLVLACGALRGDAPFATCDNISQFYNLLQLQLIALDHDGQRSFVSPIFFTGCGSFCTWIRPCICGT